MNTDRRRQIEEIYHAAHELNADERANYLRAACADDEELRREVENLLAESGADDEFFNRPLFQVSLSLLARQLTESIVGKSSDAARFCAS